MLGRLVLLQEGGEGEREGGGEGRRMSCMSCFHRFKEK
jgi:hypothetical protein